MQKLKVISLPIILVMVLLLAACQSVMTKDDSLYHALGGKEGISRFVDVFIFEIGETKQVLHYFEDSNIQRFREKQIEHVCILSGGPCEYTGDEMVPVHEGMNITEADFNAIANAMIRALDKVDISLSARNQLLAIVASMRHEVLYK